MIGSSASAFSGRFRRAPPRSATSAIIVPSTVVPVAVSSARKSVFQATPQRTPPARQPSPQVRSLKIRSAKRRQRELPGVVDEGAGERTGHGEGDEEREQRAAQDDRAGREDVAAERAAAGRRRRRAASAARAASARRRGPGRAAHRRARRTGRQGSRTTSRFAPIAKPASRMPPAPRKAPLAVSHAPSRRPSCRRAAMATSASAERRDPQPRPAEARRLDDAAGGVGAAEDARPGLPQAPVGLEVPRQQDEGGHADGEPAVDRRAPVDALHRRLIARTAQHSAHRRLNAAAS